MATYSEQGGHVAPGRKIGGISDWVGARAALPPSSHAPRWPPARLAAVESLWGTGYLSPGGQAETLRLAKPLGLGTETTLLLLEGGIGGPAEAIADTFGTLVVSLDADPELSVIAEQRRAAEPNGRRVRVENWDRDRPALRRNSAHHAMALEALRGAPVAPVLESLAGALRPHGRIVLTEMVADVAPPAADREFAAWCRLDNRSPDLPRVDVVTRRADQPAF
ncbi:MAG: hypothetical protein WDN04_15635 [Rhodospirillales bacterium]